VYFIIHHLFGRRSKREKGKIIRKFPSLTKRGQGRFRNPSQPSFMKGRSLGEKGDDTIKVRRGEYSG